MTGRSTDSTCRLLIACPDKPGIVAAVAGLIAELGGNITDADQHTERGDAGDRFFMRLEIDPGPLTAGRDGFEQRWAAVADRFAMDARLTWGRSKPRVVLLAGPQTHCLDDLLWRWRRGEINCQPVAVISNHSAAGEVAAHTGVDFIHLPVDDASRESQEQALAATLDELKPDLVVLARYMRVLPAWIVDQYPGRMINIHHSFLPAFVGAKPYHQAFGRGVKLIGATGHYVTTDLDEGPIIAQETRAVTHRHGVDDMVRIGRDLERLVLARAVRLHLDDRVIMVGNRTIVFG